MEANLSRLISEHPEPAEESLRRRLEAIFRAQLDARIERLRARYADEERLAEYNEAHLSKSEREAARRTRRWELSERIAALLISEAGRLASPAFPKGECMFT